MNPGGGGHDWVAQADDATLGPARGRERVIETDVIESDVYQADYGATPALKVVREVDAAMTGTSGDHYGRRGGVTYL